MLVIDNKFVMNSSFMRDAHQRNGATVFTVSCYLWALVTWHHMSLEEAAKTVLEQWDRPSWIGKPVNIMTWNRLFSGQPLSDAEWKLVFFPATFIDTIKTAVTSPNAKRDCHPMYFTDSRIMRGQVFVCTDEAYMKVKARAASKLTLYRYGEAYCWSPAWSPMEGLRNEVTKVIMHEE